MSDEGDGSSQSDGYEAIPIATEPRVLLGIVGALAAGAGGVAIFTEDLEAGPVALIAFGSLFLLLSILGVVPRRAEMGGAKVDFGPIMRASQKFVTETVENATPEQRPAVLEQVAELAEVAPQIAAPALAGLAFERMALAMTAQVCEELGLAFSLEELVEQLPTMQRSISRIELDALIRLRDERRTVIAIEVKKARSLRQSGFRLLANRIRVIEASVPSFGGLLLITDDVVDTSFVKSSMQFADKFRAVVVRDADDQRRLRDAINMMIRLASDAST